MVIECPNCGTRYNLDAAKLKGANPKLKCSRCRRVFPAPVSRKATAASDRKRRAGRDENLKLPFGESLWKDEEDAPSSARRLEEEEEFVLGTETAEPGQEATETRAQEPEAVFDSRAEGMSDDEEGDVANEDFPARDELPEEELLREGPPPAGRGAAFRLSEPGKVWALFIIMGVVLAGYGILTGTLFSRPALADRWLLQLPVIGSSAGDRVFARTVILSKVSGGYQRLKGGKEVFVVTGEAMNSSTEQLRAVQVTGKLYDSDGGVLARKTIYCGNVISTRVLKDLTRREVSILQELSPPPRFALESGEASTFVIVFMEPPKNAVEFSAQVVSAQRHV